MREIAYIALGSNLGDRGAYLARARDAIAAIPECRVIGASAVEETEPLGGLAQPPYLNQMLAVETTLDPAALLTQLQRIEAEAGRVRGRAGGPHARSTSTSCYSTIALCTTTDLVIPHPALAERAFWQRELAELREA